LLKTVKNLKLQKLRFKNFVWFLLNFTLNKILNHKIPKPHLMRLPQQLLEGKCSSQNKTKSINNSNFNYNCVKIIANFRQISSKQVLLNFLCVFILLLIFIAQQTAVLLKTCNYFKLMNEACLRLYD
jgi:hypothetical protein